MRKFVVAMIIGVMLGAVNGYAVTLDKGDVYTRCKNQFIPRVQQSGWDYCSEMEGISTPAAKPVAAKKVESQRVVPDKDWVLTGVQFEINSDTLRSESMNPLNEAAATLKEHERVKVEIQGHTDNAGDDRFNQTLSEKRAQTVKMYLIQKGISENRLTTKGYGETKPIADNSSVDGRAQNRRIEFKVTAR